MLLDGSSMTPRRPAFASIRFRFAPESDRRASKCDALLCAKSLKIAIAADANHVLVVEPFSIVGVLSWQRIAMHPRRQV